MAPSLWQIIIVVVIVLVVFGPKRIPGLGKSLGEAIKGFRKGIKEDSEEEESAKIPDSAKRDSSAKPDPNQKD